MVVSVNFKDLPPDLQKQMTCAHHWDCDDPNLPVSKCHCRKCGATKEFANRVNPEQAAILAGFPQQEDPPMDGKTMKERAEQLAPARAEAEKLLRVGRTPGEVQAALARAYGHIAIGTITGWKARLKPLVAPDPARPGSQATPPPEKPGAAPGTGAAMAGDTPAQAGESPAPARGQTPADPAPGPGGKPRSPASAPDQYHPLAQALLQMLPVAPGRHHLWMAAWRAAYELLYAQVTVGGETYLP